MAMGLNSHKLSRSLFIVIAIILVGISLFIKFYPGQKSDKNIIAPYYEKSAFQKPSDITAPDNASPSSIFKNGIRTKLPIIMYHYVEYVVDQNDLIRKKLNINPGIFERQLKSFIAEGYTSYFVKDIPDILAQKETVSGKRIVLTFDDGYEDFYLSAYPILKKYHLKSTIYIMFNYLGRKGYLSEKEVQELINSGIVEIGSHTLDHTALKTAKKEIAVKEITENKTKLENKFNIKVETFAYPYGVFNKETVELVKQAGYSAAVSVIPGVYQSKENLFYLSRLRGGVFSGTNADKVIGGMEK